MRNLLLKVTYPTTQFLKIWKLQLKWKLDLVWINLAKNERSFEKSLIMKPCRKLCEAAKKRMRTIREYLNDEGKEKLRKSN